MQNTEELQRKQTLQQQQQQQQQHQHTTAYNSNNKIQTLKTCFPCGTSKSEGDSIRSPSTPFFLQMDRLCLSGNTQFKRCTSLPVKGHSLFSLLPANLVLKCLKTRL